MNSVLIIAGCLLLSAVFCGSETAFYSVSRLRLELDGRWSARVISRLLRSSTGLLFTVLIGTNLMIEIATHESEHLLNEIGLSGVRRELILITVLTPIVFLFGEVLPKELFRRRPYLLLRVVGPFIAAIRILFWPLERLLAFLTWLIARLGGMREGDLSRALDRESVLQLLREGAREGAIGAGSEDMALNVLRLFSSSVDHVHVPWPAVETLPLGTGPEELFERVCAAEHARMPVVDESGKVCGYIIGLDVLAAGRGGRIEDHLRTVEWLAPGDSLERALGRMRARGLRIVAVGTPEEPVGLLGLKDVLGRIAGELA